MKLVIAGGGTGGHLFPGVAVAEMLLEISPESKVLFIGTERGIEAQAVPKAGFDVEFIRVSGLKRMGLLKQMESLAALPRAGLDAAAILRRFGADAVLGVGGYASGPALVAARMMGIPTAICEQNSVPGLTNRLVGRFVRRVFGTFHAAAAHFPKEKFVIVGNPVRKKFLQAIQADQQNHSNTQTPTAPAAASQKNGDTVHVAVFGGSQGARALNEGVPAAMARVQEALQQISQTPSSPHNDVNAKQTASIKLTVLHQTGKNDVEATQKRYADCGVQAEVTSFVDDMVSAYRRAHVVVCRAGATTCAEVTALGIPTIFVPLPTAADDHQTHNARELVEAGASLLLPQAEMTPERLANDILSIWNDEKRRFLMVEAAQKASKIDAARVIAQAALHGFV